MSTRNSKINRLINTLFFLFGLSIGVILIWPGILKNDNRKCFFKIIGDGSDGKVSIGTILNLEPKYLFKIRNAENKYTKILLIGDQCFRE